MNGPSARLLAALLCSLCAEASPAAAVSSATITADRSNPYAGFVHEAAQRFGIPASWVRAIIHLESRGNPRAISPKGAMGLMQIMPSTWFGLRRTYRLGSNAFDPHDNILAGTALLKELYLRYGVPGAFAAYNAGPTRLQEQLDGLRPLPGETVQYLAMLDRALPERVSRDALALSSPTDWRTAGLFSPGLAAQDLFIDRSPNQTPAVAPKPSSSFALAPQSGDLFVTQLATTR
jgi:soluble lytic murein transglycosylase-like protein